MSASHLTPLGTAAAAVPPKKSRAGLAIGLGAVALLAVGGALAAPKLLNRDRVHGGGENPIGPVLSQTTAQPSATGMPTAPLAPTVAKSGDAPPPTPVDPKAPKHNVTAPNGHGPATTKATAEPPPASTGAAPPPPAVEPPPPAMTAAPPPPPATTAPPAPPPFNAATCRAATGQQRGSGSTNAKDLNLNSAASTWSACARSSIREKPAAPITASVHLRFSDSRFRGATCTGCPPALAQCIASSTTAGTVSVTFRGGDVTGDPAFDVPVTFTCE